MYTAAAGANERCDVMLVHQRVSNGCSLELHERDCVQPERVHKQNPSSRLPRGHHMAAVLLARKC